MCLTFQLCKNINNELKERKKKIYIYEKEQKKKHDIDNSNIYKMNL